MSRWSYLHEKEVVSFRANPPQSLQVLLKCFDQGFTQDDDIVYLSRMPPIPVWQSGTVAEVKVFLSGKEKYGFGKSKWDELQLQYLFAYIPYSEHQRFIEAVERTSEVLGLQPYYKGVVVSAADLEAEFAKARDELMAATDEEPGSELLAILIQDTYPRSSR